MTTAAPTTQAELFREIVSHSLNDPVLFVRSVIGAEPDPWQVEALEAFYGNKRTAIAGCNGAGKDTLIVWMALWLICTRARLKGQITGPNDRQLGGTIWPEFHKWIRHSKILPQLLTWSHHRISWSQDPQDWFIEKRVAAKRYSSITGDKQAEGIQGIHGPHVFIGITEASGVDDVNFENAQKCCTQPDNYLAVVGNPLRRSGFFYDLFNKSQFDYWYKRHVGYLECSHVDNEIAERDIEAYGEDSAFVQARIKGEFPSADADDAAIEWQLVKDAMERKKPERDTGDDLQLGVDCARFGGDEFAIAVRVGSEVVELKTRGRSSGPDMVGLIVETVNEYGGDERTLIVVDEGGMGGAGVVDPLRQTHRYRNVIGVSNNMEASDEEAFEKWDDEMWMQHIPAFLAYGKLPSDDVLLHELTTRKYEFTGKKPRQRRLESKKKMRMRKLNSPSRAESVMLSMPKAVNTGPESIPEPGVNIRSRIRWKVD